MSIHRYDSDVPHGSGRSFLLWASLASLLCWCGIAGIIWMVTK